MNDRYTFHHLRRDSKAATHINTGNAEKSNWVSMYMPDGSEIVLTWFGDNESVAVKHAGRWTHSLGEITFSYAVIQFALEYNT